MLGSNPTAARTRQNTFTTQRSLDGACAAMFSRLPVHLLRGVLARTVAPYDRQSNTTPSRSHDDSPSGLKRPGRGKLAVLSGLGLIAVLVIAGTIAIETQLIGHSQGSHRASATVTATPTRIAASKDWARVGPAFAQRAAIAESQPSRIYACGYQAPAGGNGQTGPVSVAVSNDYGTNWQTFPTPAHGSYCVVQVSTRNPQHVALFTSAICAPDSCTSTDPARLNVSLDGGAHWSTMALPEENGKSADPSYNFSWAGDTLFVMAGGTGLNGGHYLAASTNGHAFTWVDQNLTGMPSGANLAAVRAVGPTLYLSFGLNPCGGNSGCLMVARSSDGGATWTRVTPTYVGTAYQDVGAIRIVAGAPGAPLVGSPGTCKCDTPPTLLSADGGATWRELPAYPSTNLKPQEFFSAEAPDGTVYVTLYEDFGGPENVFALAPGATSWQKIVYSGGLTDFQLQSVAWDAKGHPVALWGWDYANDQQHGLRRFVLP